MYKGELSTHLGFNVIANLTKVKNDNKLDWSIKNVVIRETTK
ncbi:hypothetical protein [Romboutsia sp.]